MKRRKGKAGKAKAEPPSKKRKEAEPVESKHEVVAARTGSISHTGGTTQATVLTFGQGDFGQLGLGESMTERKKPFPVAGLLSNVSIVQVECGGMHTVALSDQGKVYTWGCNDEGALGRITRDAEEYSPGLVELSNKDRILHVSAGDSHTTALGASGDVYCWGVFRDSSGPFGLVKSGGKGEPLPCVVYSNQLNKAVRVRSGAEHVMILTEKGDILTFGCAEQGQLGRVPEYFSSRSSRRGVSLFLAPQPVRIRKKPRTPRPVFVNIFSTSHSCFAMTAQQELFVWGLNNYGQLGTGDLCTYYQPHKLTAGWLKSCGGIGKGFAISGGLHHSVLCIGRKVYVCGRKEYGRLGLGKECSDVTTPTPIPNLSNIISVACGSTCSFALNAEGSVYSWGFGTNLQLGTGSEEDEWAPVLITGKHVKDKELLAVSSGGQHTALLVSKCVS